MSFLTDRDPRQRHKAGALFQGASDSKVQLVLHQAVLIELVYVLKNFYKVEAGSIAAILDDLLSMAGTLALDDVLWGRVLELWPGRFPDLADAMLADTAGSSPIDSIATFDRDFEKRLRREGLASYWAGPKSSSGV